MKYIPLLFLALLWHVAAGGDRVEGEDVPSKLQTRELGGGKNKKDKCMPKGGQFCIVGLADVKVTGDFTFFHKQKGATQAKCKTTKAKLNTRKVKFCRKIDGMIHELRAPESAKAFILDSGYNEGSCKKLHGKVKVDHRVKMNFIKGGNKGGNRNQDAGDNDEDDPDAVKSGRKQNKNRNHKRNRDKEGRGQRRKRDDRPGLKDQQRRFGGNNRQKFNQRERGKASPRGNRRKGNLRQKNSFFDD